MEQQLLQEQKKPNALAFKVAIIFAIYVLVLTVLMRMLNIDPQAKDVPVFQTIISLLLGWGTYILAIAYAQNTHKKELGGYMTYGRGFSTGFKVAAYSGLFMSLLLLLYYLVIDPAAITQMVDTAIANAKDEQQVKGIEMTAQYMAYFASFGAGIFYAVMGLLISLITAAFIKKDRPLHAEAGE